MKKRKIDPILDKLRYYAKSSKDAEVCRFFNIKPNTMDIWKQRDKISDRALRQISMDHNIDFDWLMGNSDIQTNNSQKIAPAKSSDIMLKYYPEQYASAGGGAYSDLVGSEVVSMSGVFVERAFGVSVSRGMFMLGVSGESMEPTLKDKSTILIVPYENDNSHIKDGAVYAVMVENTMLVKRVSYNPVTKAIILKSDNKIYDDIALPTDELSQVTYQIIGRVVGVMDRV